MMRATHEPTLPKPWTTTRVSAGESPSAGAASRNMATSPRPGAASRPWEPSSEIGSPVTIAGVWPCSFPYSSIIQAIVCALTPPFAPPNGMPATAVFHVISVASARTSSRSTSRPCVPGTDGGEGNRTPTSALQRPRAPVITTPPAPGPEA
jgi:hypothetical protein